MNGERKCGLYIHAYKCVFIMEYYSAIKNEILPFATSWIDLEGIMLSELSQTEDKYCMTLLISGMWKTQPNITSVTKEK